MSLKKIKNKRLKLIILFIFCLFILPVAVNAENQTVIFNHLDATGDDYGPGNYYYPQNQIFQNKGHLFDLKSMTIFESEKQFKFRFSFSKLTDPWGAKYEFSLPLIEIYIDNQSGGSNRLFQNGANVDFAEDFYWDKFVKISGWWVRLFNPQSKKEESLNINDLSLSSPNSIENFTLNRKGSDIYLSLSKREIGSLKNSKVIVLIGSFDPFGYDHFRSLAKTKSYWKIYSENEIQLSKSPRVLDILVPGGSSQKEILNGKLPKLPYLKVAPEPAAREPALVDYLMPVNRKSLLVLFTYIFILVFVIYKFNYKR